MEVGRDKSNAGWSVGPMPKCQDPRQSCVGHMLVSTSYCNAPVNAVSTESIALAAIIVQVPEQREDGGRRYVT